MLNPLMQPWTWWFEWSITAVLIVGVILTSFNIYPLNIYFLLIGNFGWVLQAVIWRKASLFIVQLVISVIYLVGIINYLL